MKIPKGLTDHPAVKMVETKDTNGSDSRYIVHVHAGYYFTSGHAAGCSGSIGVDTVAEFKASKPELRDVPACPPGAPVPASLVVFTSWTALRAVHPTVAAEFELRRVADGSVYPVRIVSFDNVWIGEPCATQEEAERAALAHLRTPVALNRYWITAANERGQVTVNQLYDAATEGEARAWAFANVARDQRGSICVTLHSVQRARPVTVSLDKPDAPECVAHLVNVPLESNRAIMARAVAFVRDIRLTAEYLAVHDGDDICRAVLQAAPRSVVTAMANHAEQERALAHEQARADAARTLSGVPSQYVHACRPPVSPLTLSAGPFSALTLSAHDDGDDDDNPSGYINHYKCYACGAEWIDEWDCGVDDECGECGARDVSPYLSEEVKA